MNTRRPAKIAWSNTVSPSSPSTTPSLGSFKLIVPSESRMAKAIFTARAYLPRHSALCAQPSPLGRWSVSSATRSGDSRHVWETQLRQQASCRSLHQISQPVRRLASKKPARDKFSGKPLVLSNSPANRPKAFEKTRERNKPAGRESQSFPRISETPNSLRVRHVRSHAVQPPQHGNEDDIDRWDKASTTTHPPQNFVQGGRETQSTALI